MPDATPGNIVVWKLSKSAVQEVFVVSLTSDNLVRPQSVTFPARDGVMLQSLLYLPDEAAPIADEPSFFFSVHVGRPDNRVPIWITVQYHVDRGLAVFEPNVRGSTRFGHTYCAIQVPKDWLMARELSLSADPMAVMPLTLYWPTFRAILWLMQPSMVLLIG